MDEELKGKLKNHYQRGEGSIQDLARIYHLPVEDVLDVLNLSDLTTIEGIGDLIDQQEAGPEVTLSSSKIYKTKFTTN